MRLYLNKQGIKVLDIKVNNTIILDISQSIWNKIQENPQWKLNLSEKIISKLKL
jgi:hypothetical protein